MDVRAVFPLILAKDVHMRETTLRASELQAACSNRMPLLQEAPVFKVHIGVGRQHVILNHPKPQGS